MYEELADWEEGLEEYYTKNTKAIPKKIGLTWDFHPSKDKIKAMTKSHSFYFIIQDR